MSFPAYPEYKESGVPWLGDVPVAWSVERFRHVFRESGEKIEAEVVGPMLSVSGYRGIEIKEYDDENRRRLDEELVGYRIVRPGQLVVNTMWLNYAGLGVSDHEGHVSPAYRSYWIERDVNRRFIHHLMRSSIYVQGYTRLLTGIRPNSLQMSRDDLMDFPVLLPPADEQTAIAAFLDRETAKIDAMVAEQERLIALLKEKRQAVISHAVTKGLNSQAPMKDSGIEWLGEIPAHWEVLRFKHIGDAITGLTYSPDDVVGEEGTLVLRSSNVQSGKIALGDNVYVSLKPPAALMVQPNDILVCSRNGSRALIGKNAMLTKDHVGMTWGAFMTVFRSQMARWSFWVLNSQIFEHQSSTFLTATINQLTIGNFLSMTAPVPPSDEQAEIEQHLTGRTEELDRLMAEAQSAITLLQERRAALISAAVTGKIDVRGLVDAPAEMEAA